MESRIKTMLAFGLVALASIVAFGNDRNTIDQLVSAGALQLERQIQLNEHNTRLGAAGNNRYVIVLDGAVGSGRFMEERGALSTRILTEGQLKLLDERLITFHNTFADARQTGFYVLVVNDWKLRLAKKLPRGFALSEWSDLRSYAAQEERSELDRMTAQLKTVPEQILARLRSKGYNKLAYVYMYARITTTDIDPLQENVQGDGTNVRTKSRQFISQVLRSADGDIQGSQIRPFVFGIQELLAKGYVTHFDRVKANIEQFTHSYSAGVGLEHRSLEAKTLGIDAGPGYDLYMNLPSMPSLDGEGKENFVALCKYLNQETRGTKFIFWFPGLDRLSRSYHDGVTLQHEVLDRLYRENVLSIARFNEVFSRRSCRDYSIMWVTTGDDLTAGIPDGYNQFTKDYKRGGVYQYSFSDLVSRHEQRMLGSLFWQAIATGEKNGEAEPISQADGVEQYVALYNTTSALCFWMKHYFIEVAEPATIANAARALRKFKVFSPKSELRASAETSLASSRKKLKQLEEQYPALGNEARVKVDKLGTLDGIGVVGGDGSAELLILGRHSSDEFLEIGRVVEGRVEPVRFLDEGTPLGDVFDGHQLATQGEEVGFLRRVADKGALLSKLDDFPNVQKWAGSIATTDTRLIENLASLDRVDLGKLNTDIVHSRYGDEIKELLRENPDDLTDIWKRLKDDPAYSWELQKTGGSRWTKWSQREFFRDVTGKGQHFEREVCLVAFRNRTSSSYLELKNKVATDFGKNLDEYDLYSQVQLKYDGEDYFVADQLFVRYRTDFVGGQRIDDMILIENKLSIGTPLTEPQRAAMNSRTYVVRNQLQKLSEFGTENVLRYGNVLEFDQEIKWYKIHDGGDGSTIRGISKM